MVARICNKLNTVLEQCVHSIIHTVLEQCSKYFRTVNGVAPPFLMSPSRDRYVTGTTSLLYVKMRN